MMDWLWRAWIAFATVLTAGILLIIVAYFACDLYGHFKRRRMQRRYPSQSAAYATISGACAHLARRIYSTGLYRETGWRDPDLVEAREILHKLRDEVWK